MSQSAMKQERREAIDKLREWIRPGDTIYTILRHVSRSGMQRAISPLLLIDGNTPDSELPRLQAAPTDVSKWAATALGCRIDRDHYGVRINGGGMDMGAHLVYELSARLFPDGYGCIGEKCQSNEHSKGDRDYTPHGGISSEDCRINPCYCHGEQWQSNAVFCSCGCKRVEHWHRDGGYAVAQRWL